MTVLFNLKITWQGIMETYKSLFIFYFLMLRCKWHLRHQTLKLVCLFSEKHMQADNCQYLLPTHRIRLKFKKHLDIVENNVVFVWINMCKTLQPCSEYMHRELFVGTRLFSCHNSIVCITFTQLFSCNSTIVSRTSSQLFSRNS